MNFMQYAAEYCVDKICLNLDKQIITYGKYLPSFAFAKSSWWIS